MKVISIEALNRIKEKGLKKLFPDKLRIAVGFATCGIAAGGDKIFAEFEKIIEERGMQVYFTQVGCIGYCKEEPLVNVTLHGKPLVIFNQVNKEDVPKIIDGLLKDEILEEKAFCKIEKWDHITGGEIFYGEGFSHITNYTEIPYFKHQKKIVLRNAGLINPEDIEEYVAVGGYFSLFKAVRELTPEEVINEVKQSGLRGRGGAGFPTGLKWELTKKEKSEVKYVICNADEGDPGAYMNRNEMESDPHMIIEGMTIGGYSIGATKGYIYVRAEYPLAIKRLKKAISDAKKYGFLGKNIFGTEFSFDISLVKGAGAFVCGEETALIASIEGRLGMPSPRPPFPSQEGLWGKPTNINNVETWSNIPVIIKKGSSWFSKIGAEKNSGTKVFSLVGKVKNIGLVEVSLGTPLRKIVYDIGGGGTKGKSIKAVQTGGPSGGCIPTRLFDTPVDYEHLKEIGSIMGSGGIVVMDEDTCMVNIAKYFTEFTQHESCGKCVPCREGLKEASQILSAITEGKGEEDNIKRLKEIGETIKVTSLCGLGQTAPNPVLTTIRYFENEYEDHIIRKECKAKVCKNLINFYIIPEKCVGCMACSEKCPVGAINGEVKLVHTIDQEKCIKCGTCEAVCPLEAIIRVSKQSKNISKTYSG